MGFHCDSMVMLTCKLLLAAAKAIVDISPICSSRTFFFRTQGGGGLRCVKARPKCKHWCSVSLLDHHNSTPLFVASV